jgi:hypothetical protein
MPAKTLRICCLLTLACVSGCIDLALNAPETLLPVGTPFVVKGTAAVIDSGGPCLIWEAENGITYHLFQDPRVDNETFDRVTTPGVTSRLEIAIRNDLEVVCQVGRIVEVQDVLEIVD